MVIRLDEDLTGELEDDDDFKKPRKQKIVVIKKLSKIKIESVLKNRRQDAIDEFQIDTIGKTRANINKEIRQKHKELITPQIPPSMPVLETPESPLTFGDFNTPPPPVPEVIRQGQNPFKTP